MMGSVKKQPRRAGQRRTASFFRSAAVFALLLCAPGILQARPLPGPDWMWEPVIPGYAFYRQDRLLSGSLVTGGRLTTLAAMLAYQARYARYHSAATAARNADLYYGPGMRYRDPYAGGYRSAQELQTIADRNINLAAYAAGLHLILAGVGILAGIENEEIYEKDKAPVVDTAARAESAPLSPHRTERSPGAELPLVQVTIPLDF